MGFFASHQGMATRHYFHHPIMLTPSPSLLRSVLTALLSALLLSSAAPLKASGFDPHAAGWTKTKGGQGGEVLRVTNLKARGKGSLAEALAQNGPRVIVFEVGGVIDLEGQSLRVEHPFVTIAGQTAPAPGITLIRGGLGIGTHDVIVQHLMVRPGEAGRAKKSGWEVDGIATRSGAHDVIIDHCSCTWATDENLSASGARFTGEEKGPESWRAGTSHRITFTNNLIAEGLSESTHAKGEHSKGTLVHDNVTQIAIVGNLYANNRERNPLFKGGVHGIVVNNLICNPGNVLVHYGLVAEEWGARPYQNGRMAIVGNFALFGPDTAKLKQKPALLSVRGAGVCEAYLSDNEGSGGATGIEPTRSNPGLLVLLDKAPLWPTNLIPLKAAQVPTALPPAVGARPWSRDPIDQRIINEALGECGHIISGEAEVGGYPSRPPTQARFREEEWNMETLTRKAGG